MLVSAPSLLIPFWRHGPPTITRTAFVRPMAADSLEHAFLAVFGSNLQGGPIVRDVILPGRNRDNPHVRVGVEQCDANRGAFSRVVHSDDQQVRQRLPYPFADFGIIGSFSYYFHVRLACKYCQFCLPHQFRLAHDKYPDQSAHGASLRPLKHCCVWKKQKAQKGAL